MKINVIFLLYFFITLSFAQNNTKYIKFNFDEIDKVLIISGNGKLNQMDNKYQNETKEIIIQKDIIEIGKRIFENWKNLNKITISSTLKIIRKRAFANCQFLETIIFEEN